MINYFDVFLELMYNVIILHYFLMNFSHFGLKFVENEKKKFLRF
jgi:hypothetical protein